MFQFLAKEVEEKDPQNIKSHLRRNDGTTILHMAILSQFFDLAFTIAEKYPCLLEAKDARGMIGLQLLSSNPSAFKSGSSYGLLKGLNYYCTPSEDADRKDSSLEEGNLLLHESDVAEKDENIQKPRRSMLPPTYTVCVDLYSIIASELRKINKLAWNLFCKGCSVMEGIWNEKKKHESALRLAKLLIRKDFSWELSSTKLDVGKISIVKVEHEIKVDSESAQESKLSNVNAEHEKVNKSASISTKPDDSNISKVKEKYKEGDGGDQIVGIVESESTQGGKDSVEYKEGIGGHRIMEIVESESTEGGKDMGENTPTSLLIATSNGIVEIVEEILEM